MKQNLKKARRRYFRRIIIDWPEEDTAKYQMKAE